MRAQTTSLLVCSYHTKSVSLQMVALCAAIIAYVLHLQTHRNSLLSPTQTRLREQMYAPARTQWHRYGLLLCRRVKRIWNGRRLHPRQTKGARQTRPSQCQRNSPFQHHRRKYGTLDLRTNPQCLQSFLPRERRQRGGLCETWI